MIFFIQLIKNLKVEFFIVIIIDIKKALREKLFSNSTILLFEKYQNFLNVFFRKKVDKFLSHQLSDYKIDIIFKKKPGFDFIYGMLQNELKVFKKYLNNNLIKEFIRLNHSLAASFILFIRKFNEDLRLCVNYRVLNAIIIKNQYLLPLIQKTLSRICKIEIFIIFNIIVVFNKLRMVEEKKWKTAFKTRYDLYESLIMNFGLCGILFSFQNYINDVLHEYFNDFCTIYIDDILIYNENWKKHIRHVRLIL